MSREAIIGVKQEEVNQLASKMKDAKSVVVAEYRGLTVKLTEQLRRSLRKEGCELVVAKNNIAKRAAKACGFEAINVDLKGPNGVVVAFKESVSAAKVLQEFARKNPKLIIKSGVIDGDFYTPAEIMQIALLPSKMGLLAMLASQLYSPLKDLAIGLDLLNKQKESI
ncbi:MAG: 50S ribosomal protein L10 [Candidatus Izemoplasmatales bacterium]|jgi:large subunit ribosomal protein L10|nr:50S ribosomal protein L10 [Candidatus Izemoplasmatales bacterium]MDD4595393.1 50S ribosomal protein L10 [Candidatus Izemoplasmatales bacterium]